MHDEEELLLTAVYNQAPLSEIEPLLKLCTTDALWTYGIDGIDVLNHSVLAGYLGLVSVLMRQAPPAHSHNTLHSNSATTLPTNSASTLPTNSATTLLLNNNTSQATNGTTLPSYINNISQSTNGTISPHLHNRNTMPPSSEAVNTPKLSPLHLACLLGDKSIVEEIIRIAPYAPDSRCRAAAWPAVDIVKRYAARRNETQNASRLEWSDANDVVLRDLIRRTDDEISALDVAAMSRHVECVHVLLESGGETSKKISPLERSMELNSIYSFRLLLTERPDTSIVEVVFKRALSYKRVIYLKALFEHGVDVDHALDGLNPYHVVFLYSSGMRQLTLVRSASSSSDAVRHNQGLDEVTALLLEKGFDVNAFVPLGTYPAYSLITALVQEKDNCPAQVPSYHINSLDLLLKSGVDLNFDEVRHNAANSASALSLSRASNRCAIGRDLYTSALDAYFCCLQSCDTWRPHIMEHLDRVCLSLLEAGANPNYLDARGETPLHALMRTMATQHSMGHMHADLSCMCRMLLYFGADPNVRTVEGGVHPVQLYFTTLLKIMGGVFAFRRWKSSNNATQVLQLFFFMDGDDAIEASRNITSELNAAREDGMPQEVIDYACTMMAEYMNTVKSLQDMSRLALWKAVSRRIVSLKKLHMPRAFIAAIKELFMLDI